ncbi:MAG: sulfotransferase, partial [Candidatus Krumholzibacteria bacterium]|nr:sulfotransferase [Candidatus Krumholzibacteria bacterium]
MGTIGQNDSNPAFRGPIFVVGAPRTGTTLTMGILNKHSQVHLYNEVHYSERIYDTMPNDGILDSTELEKAAGRLLKLSPWKKGAGSSDSDLSHLISAAQNFGGRHSSIFEAFLTGESHAHGKVIWGDSSPQDVLYIARLKRWYPDAKFIGVVRDPRGFLASYKNYYRKELKSYRNRFNPLANSLLWRSYMRSLQSAKSSKLGPDVHLLHYEDLVRSPEPEIQRMCSFLGIPYEESMLEVGQQNSSYFSVKEDHKKQGISAGSRDRWRSELS